MTPKDAARVDVRAGVWRPNRFTTNRDKVAYGTAWDYHYSMQGVHR